MEPTQFGRPKLVRCMAGADGVPLGVVQMRNAAEDMEVIDVHAQTCFAHVEEGTLKRLFEEYGLDEACFGSERTWLRHMRWRFSRRCTHRGRTRISWQLLINETTRIQRRIPASCSPSGMITSCSSTWCKATNRKHCSNGSRAKGRRPQREKPKSATKGMPEKVKPVAAAAEPLRNDGKTRWPLGTGPCSSAFLRQACDSWWRR